MKKALIILANGFEDIEAVTPIDILRRGGITVIVAGLGGTEIKGSRGTVIKAEIALEDYNGVPDALILPGGNTGAENLALSPRVKELILSVSSKGKIVAAICAAPALVLAPTGILDGKKATCYPGMEENFSPKVKASGDDVVQDGNIITSRGPATAFPFALKILENLAGKNVAETIAEGTLYSRS